MTSTQHAMAVECLLRELLACLQPASRHLAAGQHQELNPKNELTHLELFLMIKSSPLRYNFILRYVH